MRIGQKTSTCFGKMEIPGGVASDWQSRGSADKAIHTAEPQKMDNLLAPGKEEIRGSML